MTSKSYKCAVLLILAGCFAGACAASDQADDQSGEVNEGTGASGSTVCVPGHQTECACSGGSSGVQKCLPDGSGLGECECGLVSSSSSSSSGEEKPCGNGVCGDNESCHTCVDDCGVCEPCDLAPSCDNAFVPAANLPHAPDFDVPKMDYISPEQLQQRLQQWVSKAGPEMRVLAGALDDVPHVNEHPLVTALREVFADHPAQAEALRRQLDYAGMGTPASYRAKFPAPLYKFETYTTMDVVPPGGTMECGAPMLRLGVNKIKVHEEDDDWANDIVYCVIQAEAAAGAEVRITPKTPNLDEGESYKFALESGVFWGQQGPTTPAGNMLITYDCIEADTSDGYQNLINGIGKAAGQIGDVVEGDSGWIFKTAGAIAPVVSSGLALDGDDHLFNAQQTIPLDKQLELSNGAYWTVRRDGTHNLSDWDWELFVQVWGCAEYGTL